MNKNRIVGIVLAFLAFAAFAPANAQLVTLFSETFNANWTTTSPPTGWIIKYSDGVADNNDWHRYTHSTYGPVARLYWSPSNTSVDSLISPVINCTGYSVVWYAANTEYNCMGASYPYKAQIRGSINGGVTYPYLVRDFGTTNFSWQRDSLNISSWAANQANVRIAYCDSGYIYNINYEYIDNFTVYGGNAAATRQPDNWVKNSADANPGGYIGDNIYEYPTPSGSQTKAQTVNPGATAIYHIRLTNDGSATDSFRITGPSAPANWTYTYYDALTGGNNITAAVTGAGWNTGAIATTAYREIRVEVTPSVAVAGGTTQNVDITSTSINDGTKHDVVRGSTTTASARQPDNHIKLTSEAATLYVGDNIYNLDGTSQTKTMYTDPLQVASYTVRIQNDGNAADNMTVTGTAGNANFTVAYYDAPTGGTNITSSVTGAGWTTGSLAVGATREIRVEVTPTASAPVGTTFDVLVTSRSGLDATKRDAVKASTIVINHRPDNHIKNSAEAAAAYVGDGIYNTDGTSQTKSQNVDAGSTVIYNIRIQNDGNYAEAYTVTGTGNGNSAHATWTVRYFNALTGGTDITSSVTGAGWSTGSLAPGATTEIRCEVTPNAGAWGGENYSVLVTSTAPGYGSMKDAVRATTTVNSYFQPDNLIKRASEASYVGDGIYNNDGTDQTSSYITNYWKTVVFDIRIENDSNTVDTYNVTGPASSGGWTVQYFDAVSGGNDITADVTGAGWSTGSLDPDGSREIRVEITGSTNADTLFEALVKSTSTLSTSNVKESDAVKIVVISASAQPDLMVKLSTEIDYTGDNVYNQTGLHQTKDVEILATQMAVFNVQIENDYMDEDGNPDVFTLRGTAGNASWNIKYYDMLTGGADITSAMTASGWSTGEVLPLGTKRIRIEVTPDTTMPDSSFYEITVKATSQNDGNRKDLIKAIPIYRNKVGIGESFVHITNSLTVETGKVSYSLAKSASASLKVYDVAGNLVTTLASGTMAAGQHSVAWQAPAKGVYFVKLSSPDFTAVRKVTILN